VNFSLLSQRGGRPSKALFVTIEGIDQSGKSTQARLIEKRLRREGMKVGSISFPVYGSPSGRLIKGYLTGKRRVSFRAMCMLYSLNRWEQRDALRDLLNENDIVISCRYVPSGLAYGAAGGLSPKWLANLDDGLPTPDAVLVIDVPVQTSTIRKTVKRDVHERNIKYLRNVRRCYLQLAKRKGWQIVSGTGSVQEVSRRILKRVR